MEVDVQSCQVDEGTGSNIPTMTKLTKMLAIARRKEKTGETTPAFKWLSTELIALTEELYIYFLKTEYIFLLLQLNEFVSTYASARWRCTKALASSTAALFGRRSSSFHRGGGEERRGEEVERLSSVAVVGRGRPSLGDAHYQFFWRDGVRKTSIRRGSTQSITKS